MEISEDEQEYLKEVSLLTIKPVIYACNMGEDDFNAGIESNPFYKAVEQIAAAEGAETLPICAEMEQRSPNWTRTKRPCSLVIWGWKKRAGSADQEELFPFGSDFLPDRR